MMDVNFTLSCEDEEEDEDEDEEEDARTIYRSIINLSSLYPINMESYKAIDMVINDENYITMV